MKTLSKAYLLISCLLLIGLSVVSSAGAYPYPSYNSPLPAVAWYYEENTIFVAIANESLSRNTVTIEVWEPFRRNAIAIRPITLPARSVYIEQITLRNTYSSNEPIIEEVLIKESFYTNRIPVQYNDLFTVQNYVVRYNTKLDIQVNVGSLFDIHNSGELVVADQYTISGEGRPDKLEIQHVQGGLYQQRGRNRLEYRQPSFVISLRTPNMRGSGILTFGIQHIANTSPRPYREYIQGPSILVYGSDMWLVNEPAALTTPPGRGKK